VYDGRSFWVGAWWAALSVFGVLNVLFWTRAARSITPGSRRAQAILSGLVVFGCAFRSFFPRADVQRICLFDSWISSVAVGRSVATVAELCIVAQWALYCREIGRAHGARGLVFFSRVAVPLITVAEVASWSAVLTENYLGNVIEQSLWTLTATVGLVGAALSYPRLGPALRRGAKVALGLCAGYIAFMLAVDIPMYLGRHRADTAAGKQYLSLGEGIYQAAHSWTVTRRFGDWHDEMAWMFFYFSIAVWMSIALVYPPGARAGGRLRRLRLASREPSGEPIVARARAGMRRRPG
jgi:hypothetical protein